MADENWQQIRNIFDEAIRRNPSERLEFVRRECGENNIVLEEVESLLTSLDSAESFLEIPVVAKISNAMTLEQPQKLECGEAVGQYNIISQIGEGGMGEVYLAEDTRLNRKVALKFLVTDISEDKNHVRRFQQEAFATSALNHPNIVTIYEIGKWQDRDFIVTEFIDGVTLRVLLRKKKLTVGGAVEIALQIASALSAAHGAGIVHRDIKPENIVNRNDGLVKVLDFGIAKYRPTEAGRKVLVETKIGEVVGTVAYMSPEQVRGKEVDTQTDIWSLGIILYEMIAGRLPFAGDTKSDRIAAILEHEPEPISKLNRNISPELERVIKSALAKDKKARYKDIADLAEDLHLLRETTGDKLQAPLIFPLRKTASVRREIYWFVALSLLVLLFTAVGLWFYLPRSSKTTGSDKKSIVILPLKPINTGNRDELYEIGIADSLINRLGSGKGFVVRPLSAVRKYADLEQDPLAAGQEQKVDYVLASNYQIAGGKIRVTSQLFNVENGQIEETYKTEKDAGDVFAMEDAVAGDVGNLLQARFGVAQSKPMQKRGTENEEAYRLYLQGIHFNDKRLPPDGEKAVEYFEKAVRLDPNYARAWAGVAFAHRSLMDIGADVDYQEQHRISMEAVGKALALDPNLSEAYNALCLNKLNYEYDASDAETACKRAIELDPNSPLAHNTYARLLFSSRSKRFDEAIAEIKTAIDLDPTSFYHQIVYTVALTYARRYDEARQQLERLAQRNPKRAVSYFWLVGGVAFQGKQAEDFERLTRFQKLAETDEETVRVYKTAYQTDGWHGVLRQQAKRSYEYNPMFYFFACLYAQIGDKDKAFEYLEKTYHRREHWMAYIEVDPRFDSLRGDPRFGELVKRVESK